jgi:hypothetical protein
MYGTLTLGEGKSNDIRTRILVAEVKGDFDSNSDENQQNEEWEPKPGSERERNPSSRLKSCFGTILDEMRTTMRRKRHN